MATPFEVPDFPFTPGWIPEGVSDAYANPDPSGVALTHYDLGGGRVLVVETAGTLQLDRDDLIRFAEGITVTAAALPGPDYY